MRKTFPNALRAIAIKIMVGLIALAAGLLFALASHYWTRNYWPDLAPPICTARALLAGAQNPYTGCATDYGGRPAAQYPMTTILAVLPFAALPGRWAISASWGAINALLVYGILCSGKPWRLLVFVSAPYALAFVFHQISPLIAATLVLPSLLPLALVKPQIGFPVILARLTAWRIIACVAFGLLTFTLLPGWVPLWLESARNFDGLIPLLVLPFGPLLVLAALRRETRLLFWFALTPQRGAYDLVPLVLLAKSRHQMLVLIAIGWLGLLASLSLLNSVRDSVHLSIVSVYLPPLALALLPSFAGAIRIFGRWSARIRSLRQSARRTASAPLDNPR